MWTRRTLGALGNLLALRVGGVAAEKERLHLPVCAMTGWCPKGAGTRLTIREYPLPPIGPNWREREG
jgi:hypothetical protein